PNDLAALRLLPQLLGQQLSGLACSYQTSVQLTGGPEGTRAGLVLLGQEYVWLGLQTRDGGTHLVCRRSGADDSPDQRPVEVPVTDRLIPAGRTLALRLRQDGAGSVAMSRAHGVG